MRLTGSEQIWSYNWGSRTTVGLVHRKKQKADLWNDCGSLWQPQCTLWEREDARCVWRWWKIGHVQVALLDWPSCLSRQELYVSQWSGGVSEPLSDTDSSAEWRGRERDQWSRGNRLSSRGVLILRPKSTPIDLNPWERVAPATHIIAQAAGASALLEAIPSGQCCFLI